MIDKIRFMYKNVGKDKQKMKLIIVQTHTNRYL